ncbi:MAG: hypothetical protein CM15mP45_03730 [Deltaproteobacteria bacterium]|nr:MAG: hypothetical protein CM15mP45_03730 [Deltaproteobacteria bacterium]
MGAAQESGLPPNVEPMVFPDLEKGLPDFGPKQTPIGTPLGPNFLVLTTRGGCRRAEKVGSATFSPLHFIDHEQPVLVIAEGLTLPYAGRDLNAAFALNGLDKYSDFFFCGEGLLNRL